MRAQDYLIRGFHSEYSTYTTPILSLIILPCIYASISPMPLKVSLLVQWTSQDFGLGPLSTACACDKSCLRAFVLYTARLNALRHLHATQSIRAFTFIIMESVVNSHYSTSPSRLSLGTSPQHPFRFPHIHPVMHTVLTVIKILH
jgi:hypothetical protein